MPTVYKYQPYVVPGPSGTKIMHQNNDQGTILLLGQIAGYYYISVPDGEVLPQQPEQITLEEVPLTFETKEHLRWNLNTFQTGRRLADDKIKKTIGDTDYQIADLAKRIGMVERLVMRMSIHLLKNQDIPIETRDAYLPIVEHYLDAIDIDGVRDRVDLESNVRIAQVLTQRFATIAGIVDDLHMSRVKAALGE